MTKAIVVEGPYEYKVVEVGPERISEDAARIRVKKIGLCASDLKIIQGTHPFAQYPLIPGHEFSGEVLEVGKGCTTLRPGQKVVIFPLFGCGTCEPCQRDEVNRCPELGIVGVNKNGGFRQDVTVEERHLLPLAVNVSFEEASLTEPIAVALHACHRGNCGPGDRVAVLGAGTIGLLIIQVAITKGADVLLATDLFDNRLRIAEELGAKETVNLTKYRDNLREEKGREYNLVFDCVGTEETFCQAVSLAGSGGRIVLVGLPNKEWRRLPVSEFFRKELSLIVTRLYDKGEFRLAIDLVSKGAIDPSRIITHHMNLRDFKEAISLMEHSKEIAIKILLTPS